MALNRSDWVVALDAEIAVQATPLRGAVAEAKATPAGLWHITLAQRQLQREGKGTPPADDLVGCTVQQHPAGLWKGRVAAVDPDRGEITIDVEEGQDPVPRQNLVIDPPAYLVALRTWIYENAPDPEAIVRARLASFSTTPSPPVPAPPGLRSAQRQAFDGARRPFLIVWGPPGTGKTFTLAAILAAHVQAGRKVLALAPTRVAADALTVLLDDTLKNIGVPARKGAILRTDIPEQYPEWRAQRPHLLAWADVDEKNRQLVGETVDKLRKLERRLADPRLDPDERARLIDRQAVARARLEKIRVKYREKQASLVHQASVVLSTVRQAISRGWSSGFAVVAVDEAGMVSVSDALWALAVDAPSVVFAGDHRQLGPIVQAERTASPAQQRVLRAYLGTSLLEHLDRPLSPWRILLDEQSRMNAELCAYVSNTFYGGRLRPIDAPPAGIPGEIQVGAGVLPPAAERDPDLPEAGGPHFSPEGATAIIRLARRLAGRFTVLAMSCYRDQARLLHRALGDLQDRGVRAGTVHRMQGQEADVAFYDPVGPNSFFPKDSPDAPRLTNVAASRARRAFLVVGTPETLRQNPYLAGLIPGDTPPPRRRGVLRQLVDDED